jgi:hypothetical protein
METAVEAPQARGAARELSLSRIGGMAGIAGGVLGIIANVLHPRLAPNDLGKPDKMLDMVSGYSLWLIDHLAVVVAALLGLLALVAIARSMLHTPAQPWARLALFAAIATGAVGVVAFSIDGSVVAGIAREWAATSGAARADVLNRFALIQYFDTAFFSMTVFGLFGATQLLFGLALRKSGIYAGWLGLSAIVGGVIGLVSGAWMWMSSALTVGNFLILFTITSVVLTIWLIAASWRLMRMSETPAELVG